MPSLIAHSVSGYVLAKFLPQERHQRCHKWQWRVLYPILIANAADLDFVPQIITGELYHRGITHSLVFALGLSAIAGSVANYAWKTSYKRLFWFTLVIYISHILLDCLTEGRGVQLLAPFTDSFYRLPINIFPGVHYSQGLWDIRNLLPLGFESIYAVVLFWGLQQRQQLRTADSKEIAGQDNYSARRH